MTKHGKTIAESFLFSIIFIRFLPIITIKQNMSLTYSCILNIVLSIKNQRIINHTSLPHGKKGRVWEETHPCDLLSRPQRTFSHLLFEQTYNINNVKPI